MTTRETIELGIKIAELCNLTLNNKGRYNTTQGEKSPEQMGKIIQQLLEKNNDR